METIILSSVAFARAGLSSFASAIERNNYVDFGSAFLTVDRRYNPIATITTFVATADVSK